MNAGVIGYAAMLMADAAMAHGWTLEAEMGGQFPWGMVSVRSGVIDPSVRGFAMPYALQILEIRTLPEATR